MRKSINLHSNRSVAFFDKLSDKYRQCSQTFSWSRDPQLEIVSIPPAEVKGNSLRVHPHCWVGSVRRVARNAKRSPLRAREPCFYSKLVSRRNTRWQTLETSCYRICIPPLLGSESRRIFHICLPGLRRAASCVGKRGLAEDEIRRAAVESARGGKIWQIFQSLSLEICRALVLGCIEAELCKYSAPLHFSTCSGQILCFAIDAV